MLKLLNIIKEYKIEEETTLALNDVSIEFRKNEFVSILGPSGCGKTTLLNIVGGLDRYSSGDIQIDGISTKEYDDVDWDTYRNRRIGFVFQSYNLIPHINILKNVELSLTLAGVDHEESKQRALDALEKVGLREQARKKPNQLSGGQAQRVAIARALVTNPDIILADEPTGALDSESGIQVMDLLKEVAQDRLVIMVTHNPSLAEEYSTRIVYLKDGQVVGDTMPYCAADEVVDTPQEEVVEEVVEIVEQPQDEVNDKPLSARKIKKIERKESRLAKKLAKIRHADKQGMKIGTAISLSWTNLLAKKGRTLLTSIAGSIGIIGIILVLSLSTGATKYITSLEESALSTYPLTVQRTNLDVSTALSMLMEPTDTENNRAENPDTTQIYTSLLLGKVFQPKENPDGSTTTMLQDILSSNDLERLSGYIEDNKDKINNWADVRYNYGINFNAFIQDPTHPDTYMKVNPYTETMQSVLGPVTGMLGDGVADIINEFTSDASMMSSWTQMSSNQDLLESQYELVGSQSRWPSSATEVVIVVDRKNQLQDFQYFMLGLISQNDVLDAIMNGADWSKMTTSVDELLALEYKILPDTAYLVDNGDGTWTGHNHAEQDKEWIDAQNPIDIDVVGVIRPKEGVSVTSISGVLGYTEGLTDLLSEISMQHPAVEKLLELQAEAEANGSNKFVSPITYDYIKYTGLGGESYGIEAGETVIGFDTATATEDNVGADITKSEVMRKLGIKEYSKLISIDFYCHSFEGKEAISYFIENTYQVDTGEKVKVTDTLAVIMSFVNTMADTLTGVLIAFAAISLVVSTIMIAIIIYTSVLERRKEIGVLRSIGARKKDVARIFIAESAILGGYSGLIGIVVAFVLSFVGSAILDAIFAISGLMTITWWHCIMMFGISVLLSMFAGFIPSRIAADKDPAIALRSE